MAAQTKRSGKTVEGWEMIRLRVVRARQVVESKSSTFVPASRRLAVESGASARSR